MPGADAGLVVDGCLAEQVLVVPGAIRDALLEHALAELPNEACGLLALRDGAVCRYLPADNAAASPYRFELRPRDPAELAVEEEGFELGVFHSHPASAALPSRTDLEHVGLWSGAPYLILSLQTGELAGFRVVAGRAERLSLAR